MDDSCPVRRGVDTALEKGKLRAKRGARGPDPSSSWLLAWFALYLYWFLPPPDELRWKFWLRIAAVICAALVIGALSLGASDDANAIGLFGFFVVLGIGTAWASRPIKHTG